MTVPSSHPPLFPEDGTPPPNAAPADQLQAHSVNSIPAPIGPTERAIPLPVFSVLLPEPDGRDRTLPVYQSHENRLTDDIAARGQRQPIYVMRLNNGRYRCLTGWTRTLACRRAGKQTVLAFVLDRPLNEAEQDMEKLLENEISQGFTPLERAAIYQRLMKANGWSQAELIRNLPGGREKKLASQVSKDLAISKNLCQEVQAWVAAGEVAPRGAYAISHLSDIPTQVDLADKLRKDLLSVEGVEAQVAKLLGKREHKAKPMKITHGGVSAVVKGNPLEALKNFIAKIQDTLKRLEKENLPAEILPALLK